MTINYTKQKLEMTTITQNKIGKVVPWGWGGGEGRTESKKVLFFTMVKKKKLCSKKLNIVTSKEHLVYVPWLHCSQSEWLKMHTLLN
jgi:hypothetical protein